MSAVRELYPDQHRAVLVTGKLWATIRAASGPYPADKMFFRHVPGLFLPDELADLPLPIGEHKPPEQTVALGGGALQFTRPETDQQLAEEYQQQPRVKIYESIDGHTGGWPALVTTALGRLANTQATCTVYESSAGEHTLGPHQDDWYGAIVQKEGAKHWYIGDDAIRRPDEPTLTLQAGDVLLLPRGLMHDVATPEYSVHMGFAILPQR